MIREEDVTIIIPHLGKAEEQKRALYECFTSLNETVPNIKKIIAINGLTFEEDFTLSEGPEFLVNSLSIMVLEEQGQCKAVNAAAATVTTPWIFVTNDDMIYAPGWFEKLTELVRDELCISPQLVEPRPGAPTFLTHFCGGAGGDFDKQKFIEFAGSHSDHRIRPGFNLPFLIRKDLWDTVGGYDVNYDPWGSNSDSDLEYKIKLAGVQPYQNTNCVVYHFSQTSGTFEPRNQSYWSQNWQYFIDKWGFPRTDDGIWQATFSIPSALEGRKFLPDWESKYEKK